jgi:LuxR family maltose regulon positive regulatory protein
MSSGFADPRLSLPALPPRHVPRPRLLEALDGADAPLILIAAGPGAGKTVLLADWAARQTTPVAWLALTWADNEPRRFWALFLAAARASGRPERELPSVWVTGMSAEVLDSVYPTVPESPSPLVVVLDDAHVLSHPEILDGLDRIVRRWQHRLRLVVAARSDPLLPLHRYRLAGQMRELRASDLAMTRPETAALLAAHGLSLPEPAFEQLAIRTEGWTAGVRLSALRMEGTEHPEDFVAELALDQGSIGEYLIDEVLDRQPEHVRRVLIETSFLSEVNGSLAEAITGIGGGAGILTELARTNSFVIPLDAAHSRFRYHQLLGEILRHLALRRSPVPPDVLRGRAAAWFDAHGDLPDALYWAIQAHDDAYVTQLLIRGGLAQAFVRRQDLADSGLRQMVDIFRRSEAAGAAADVVVSRWAVVAAICDETTAADELEQLQAARPDLAEEEAELRATADLAEMIIAQKAGAFATVDAAARRLLAAADADGWVYATHGLRASVLLAQARARMRAGRPDDVERLLQEALGQSDGLPAVQVEILANMAQADSYAARPRRANDAESRAVVLLERHPRLVRPALLDVAIACRAYLEADFPTMAQAVRRATLAGPLDSDPGVAAAAVIVQASVLTMCGQIVAARTALEDSPALGDRAGGLLAVLRDGELAAIEMALGRPRGALRLLGPYRVTPLWVCVAVAAARAYLAAGDLTRAQNCVRSVITAADSHVTRYHVVDAILCDAQVAQRRGDDARALEMLVRATEIADGDIVLPFLRVADEFAPLLARHSTVAAEWPTSPGAPDDDVRVRLEPRLSSDLPDPLTDRERAVLRFLATSMSTAEIADELCLSINTVKTHLAAIYRKLAARKRREAVQRARVFELL